MQAAKEEKLLPPLLGNCPPYPHIEVEALISQEREACVVYLQVPFFFVLIVVRVIHME
jgi:hypothetical protein